VSTTTTPHGRRGLLAAAAVTVALGIAGTTAVIVGLQPSGGPPQPSAADSSGTANPITASPSAVSTEGSSVAARDAAGFSAKTLSRSSPVSIAIPSLGVDSHTLVNLGKQADGSLQVPTDFGKAGWYTDGPAPGQFGPAVIAGHVDSTNGPGIFYKLGALRTGATITIGRADGSTARFSVDKVARYPKDRFPTNAVYGDTTQRAELRLITCGGGFDKNTGHYLDNVVAFAHLL